MYRNVPFMKQFVVGGIIIICGMAFYTIVKYILICNKMRQLAKNPDGEKYDEEHCHSDDTEKDEKAKTDDDIDVESRSVSAKVDREVSTGGQGGLPHLSLTYGSKEVFIRVTTFNQIFPVKLARKCKRLSNLGIPYNEVILYKVNCVH